eukprot:NODE_2002_length_789_cov_19.863514_g1593_i0.p4 GENE.NODE_2002_length_789_cov_19.863514_g1593_i0~~NODE_2002_length_789_cov_19.863514_g1593_i0.p4  ORF type:complete len:58 (+),score=5.79 NODE_2002_length_789_cov_19.863514_g1593_i0:95-268(+)
MFACDSSFGEERIRTSFLQPPSPHHPHSTPHVPYTRIRSSRVHWNLVTPSFIHCNSS